MACLRAGNVVFWHKVKEIHIKHLGRIRQHRSEAAAVCADLKSSSVEEDRLGRQVLLSSFLVRNGNPCQQPPPPLPPHPQLCSPIRISPFVELSLNVRFGHSQHNFNYRHKIRCYKLYGVFILCRNVAKIIKILIQKKIKLFVKMLLKNAPFKKRNKNSIYIYIYIR